MKLATSAGAGGTAQQGKSKGKPAPGALTAEGLVALLSGDSRAQTALAGLVMAKLLQANFAAHLVGASTQLASASRARGPGMRLAGTVSTLSGAITGPTPGSAVCVAMVFLHGASTAVACYVPPHIVPDLATGQDVWVEPVNGSITDLMVVAVRGAEATPIASQALTNAATAQTTANTALTHRLWLQGPQAVSIANIASGGHTTIAFAGNYGVPSGALGVLLNCYFDSTGSGVSALWYPGTTSTGASNWNLGYTTTGSLYCAGQGWVPLSSGEATVVANGGALNGIFCYVVGYTM